MGKERVVVSVNKTFIPCGARVPYSWISLFSRLNLPGVFVQEIMAVTDRSSTPIWSGPLKCHETGHCLSFVIARTMLCNMTGE